MNYLNDFILDSDEYKLGYWTTNGTYAFGHNGSSINADIYVKDSDFFDVLDGNLNFTLYNPDGTIVPMKNETDYVNISYIDVTPYTILETTQFSSGRYVISTILLQVRFMP